MPLDAEGADSGDAPEEEAEDVSQVSGDQCVAPPPCSNPRWGQAAGTGRLLDWRGAPAHLSLISAETLKISGWSTNQGLTSCNFRQR